MTASMKIEAMAPETWSFAPQLPRERRLPSRAVNVTSRATTRRDRCRIFTSRLLAGAFQPLVQVGT